MIVEVSVVLINRIYLFNFHYFSVFVVCEMVKPRFLKFSAKFRFVTP